MTLHAVTLYASALLLMAMAPGPFVAALLPRSISYGFRRTTPLIWGAVVGDMIWAAAALFGLAAAAQLWAPALTLVRVGGGAYLVWMGWRMLAAPPEAMTLGQAGEAGGFRATFLSGLAVTLGNPKPALFYLALLPVFFDIGKLSGGEKILILAVIPPVLLLVLCSYAALAAEAGRRLKTPGGTLWLNRVCGAAMILAGAALAANL
ncbi:LysE family translocator [Neomegalonema sp.]|uniref:LysE family translocator n=1 Tax=Neomegalonema sp. TaxID=2039713 RepID=UPI00262E6124|nr:LysE family translocator [Neomegalonema sp.]MDD2869554.1 LysE family translocator [Neomegalonema sp.]